MFNSGIIVGALAAWPPPDQAGRWGPETFKSNCSPDGGAVTSKQAEWQTGAGR